MSKLEKIEIGVQDKRNHFNLSHDVETTSDFGFCQPTIVRQCTSRSSISGNTNTFVRLAPMPVPTFGRIKVKTYNSAIPISEVFEAFPEFMSKAAINVGGSTRNTSYIPQTADYINSRRLLANLVAWDMQKYLSTGGIVQDFGQGIFNYVYLVPEDYTVQPVGTSSLPKNITNWVPCGRSKKYQFNSLPAFDFSHFDYNCIAYALVETILGEKPHTDAVSIPELSRLTDPYRDHTRLFTTIYDDWETIDGTPNPFYRNPVLKANYRNVSDINNCDFVFKIPNVVANERLSEDSGDSRRWDMPCYVGMNLTKKGQRLMKVLRMCGFNGFKYNYNMDLLKLLAYYRAYFDIMNPGRNKQWYQTSAYRIIHNFYDTNKVSDFSLRLNEPDLYLEYDDTARTQYLYGTYCALIQFFTNDLPNCLYCEPVNNVSVSTLEPLNDQESNYNGTSIDVHTSSINTVEVRAYSPADPDNREKQYGTMINGYLNGLTIESLMRIYHRVNKNSIIGNRINEYMLTHFGYAPEQSTFINSSDFVVNIDDVFSTANTSDGYLGEFAGQGRGTGKDGFKVDSKEPFIFVQFLCVIPYGGFVQGNNAFPTINYNDFYQSEYDSMGKEPFYLSQVFNQDSIDLFKNNRQFGFRPQYFNWKTANSVHNGDFARKSGRNSILPYSLDKIFSESVIYNNLTGDNHDTLTFKQGTIVPCSEELRFIGKYEDFGNYDRIFYDVTGATDNFILHIVQDLHMYAPMRSIGRSFETFDDTKDSDTKAIESV